MDEIEKLQQFIKILIERNRQLEQGIKDYEKIVGLSQHSDDPITELEFEAQLRFIRLQQRMWELQQVLMLRVRAVDETLKNAERQNDDPVKHYAAGRVSTTLEIAQLLFKAITSEEPLTDTSS